MLSCRERRGGNRSLCQLYLIYLTRLSLWSFVHYDRRGAGGKGDDQSEGLEAVSLPIEIVELRETDEHLLRQHLDF